MARDILQFNLELDRLFCHDEGDGWGDAEPYIWTIMFKVDGDTISVTDTLGLSGNATIETSVGSQGNLGTTDVDEGDNVIVPANVGHYDGRMTPIPVPPPLNALVEDVSGIVGLVVVVMEEDNVSAAGAEAGHQALNDAVAAAVNQIVATRTFSNPDIGEDEIAQFTSSIESTISSAIQSQQNFFENIWAWVNPDDLIGQSVFMFTHDELAAGGTINFSSRYANEGDWEIFGHITSSVVCPANALDNLFAGISGSRAKSDPGSFAARTVLNPKALTKTTTDKRSLASVMNQLDNTERKVFDLDPLRKFRDGTFRKYAGLSKWWELFQRNSPAIVHALLTEPSLRKPTHELMGFLSEFAANPKKPIPREKLDLALKLVMQMKSKTNNRKLAKDCGWVLEAIPHLREKNGTEALKFLSKVSPSKRPKGLTKQVRAKKRTSATMTGA